MVGVDSDVRGDLFSSSRDQSVVKQPSSVPSPSRVCVPLQARP